MKLKHYDNEGHARFVTFCTHHKIPVLADEVYRQAILDSIDEVKSSTGFQLLAYVIMPEHVHLVLAPAEDSSLGHLIGEIKRLSAKAIHALLLARHSTLVERLSATRNGTRRFVLWQRRCYDKNCRSEREVWGAVRYCHNNPVKRGLVSDPARWKWSSYSWYSE
ncbi:MAG: transposase [candidate division Zixibacteria bacterium]|nr:transposase [candidate division Zixibacteria bacterium]